MHDYNKNECDYNENGHDYNGYEQLCMITMKMSVTTMRMGMITMRMSLDLCTRFKNESSEEGGILDRACGNWQLRDNQQAHYDSM